MELGSRMWALVGGAMGGAVVSCEPARRHVSDGLATRPGAATVNLVVVVVVVVVSATVSPPERLRTEVLCCYPLAG